MYYQQSIFDLGIDLYAPHAVDYGRIEDALQQLRVIVQNNGNPPCGVSIEDIPGPVKDLMSHLIKAGYIKEFNNRVVLREDLIIPIEPETVVSMYLNDCGITRDFSEILSKRTEYQIRYHGKNISEALWAASVFLTNQLTIDEYCSKASRINPDIPKDLEQKLCECISLISDIEEIKILLSNTCIKDNGYLSPSDYNCVILAKADNPKDVKRLLAYCGVVWLGRPIG